MDRLDTEQDRILTAAMGFFTLALMLGVMMLAPPTLPDAAQGAPSTDAEAPLRRVMS